MAIETCWASHTAWSLSPVRRLRSAGLQPLIELLHQLRVCLVQDPDLLDRERHEKKFLERRISCSLALLYASDGALEVQAVAEKVPEQADAYTALFPLL